MVIEEREEIIIFLIAALCLFPESMMKP